MDRFWDVNQRNAGVYERRAMAQANADLEMARINAAREMELNRMAAVTGQPLEQVQTGTRRVAGAPRVGPSGPISGGYRNVPVYETRLGEAPPGAGLIGALNAGPAASSGGAGGMQSFQFAGPGGVFGGAQLPGVNQPGSANVGIDARGGQVWNPRYAQNAATMLSAPAGAPGVGQQQMFNDALTNQATANFSDLQRAGMGAEAGQTLQGQLAQSRLQNALQGGPMRSFYRTNLNNRMSENERAYRLLQQMLA
jgi:hypothetical protein